MRVGGGSVSFRLQSVVLRFGSGFVFRSRWKCTWKRTERVKVGKENMFTYSCCLHTYIAFQACVEYTFQDLVAFVPMPSLAGLLHHARPYLRLHNPFTSYFSQGLQHIPPSPPQLCLLFKPSFTAWKSQVPQTCLLHSSFVLET